MSLFHITCKSYAIGDVIILSNDSFYHNKSVSEGKGWVDNFLDNNRPEGFPSRKKALYACDSIPNCKALKNTVKNESGTLHIYEVKMKNPKKVPMSLVNFLLKKGENNPSNELIAIEYWSPSNSWKFYEYLSEEMEIVNEVINSDTTPIGNIRFWASTNASLLSEDTQLANEIY